MAAGRARIPVILPRTSEGLYLLQRVRDEAHRFAITFHRQKRSKAMTASALDGIPGLGETRRKALLRRFGSLKRLARGAASTRSLEVPGHRPADRRGDRGRAAPPTATSRSRRSTSRPARCSISTNRPTPVTAPTEGCDPVPGQRSARGLGGYREQSVGSAAGSGRRTWRTRDSRHHRPVRGRAQHRGQVLRGLGYFVVDNLPPELIATLVELGSRTRARSPGSPW